MLRKALASYDCGSLEILVRGLDVDPDSLRKRLKLKGSRPLALVLTRIGRKGVGFVCEPASGRAESRIAAQHPAAITHRAAATWKALS